MAATCTVKERIKRLREAMETNASKRARVSDPPLNIDTVASWDVQTYMIETRRTYTAATNVGGASQHLILDSTCGGFTGTRACPA